MSRWVLYTIVLLSGVTGVRAEGTPPAWDQETATSLARDLAASVQHLLDWPGLSQPQPSTIQERMRDAALSDAKRLAPRLVELADRLAAGEGLRQTRAAFTDIQHLRENIRAYAKDSAFSPDVREKVAEVRDRFDHLAILYELR